MALDQWGSHCPLGLHDHFLYCSLVLQPLKKLKPLISVNLEWRPFQQPRKSFSFPCLKQVRNTYFQAFIQKTLLTVGNSDIRSNFGIPAPLHNFKSAKNPFQVIHKIVSNHNLFKIRVFGHNHGVAKFCKRQSTNL